MSNFTDKFSPIKLDNFGLVRLPRIIISDEQKAKIGLKPDASNYDFLRGLARVGYKVKLAKIDKSKHQAYIDRVKYELTILEELGFVDYILLVWMVVEKARSFGTFMDWGRGSVSGSCVCWFLGISGVDPIDKHLIFERFVNRVRSKKQIIDGNVYLQGDLIADIDCNLGDSRDKIIEWLKEIYPNRVSQISNHSTFTGKILLKDVYKTFEEASEQESGRISSLIEAHSGVMEDLTETYEKNEEFRCWAKEHQETYDICLSLRDLIRQKSCHASGYIVSFFDFDGFLPMELNKEKLLTSSYNMSDVCNFGIKIDLLSLTTNALLRRIVDKIPEKIEDINLDSDPLIYDQFQTGKLLPYGLYQISADCAYRVVNEVKPVNVEGLSDCSALARPGALSGLSGYIKGNTECAHTTFKDILAPTRNLALYQEQLMRMIVAVGFTLDEAEICRKIVGKKDLVKVKEWEEKIKVKCKANGFDDKVSGALWKLLNDSAKYSFNLSHSLATAYLTAITVYLKYKYPVLFYWSALESTRDLANPMDEIATIVKELPVFGIKLLPPDLASGETGFSIDGQNIRFGLSSIRGVSDANIRKLVSFKRDFKHRYELFDVARESKIPINILTGLIQCGCLNIPNVDRNMLILQAQTYNLLTEKERGVIHVLCGQYNDNLLDTIVAMTKKTDEKGKVLLKESRFLTVKKHYDPFKRMYQENSKNPLLCSYIMERHYLGYSFSSDLFSIFSAKVEGLMPIKQVSSEPKDIYVKFVAFIKEIKSQVSRAKSPYLKIDLEDDSGSIKALLFDGRDGGRIEQLRQFHGKLPEPGDIVIIHGKKADGDAVFVDKLFIQNNPVKIKKSELDKGPDAI